MVSLRSVASATAGWCCRAVRKSGAVIDPTVASVSAITLAERGWPSMADSSPKLCPGPSSRNATSRPASEKMVTLSLPG